MSSPACERPFISFGREVCGDLEAALRREWLVTNGLGGYASATLAGVATRRYHGLLVAALAPPVERTVLVGGLIEWATYDGTRYPLSTHEYGDGTLDPQGWRHLQAFALDGTLPVWTYALGDALLERRLWMPHGANATYLRYCLLRASGEVALEITPLVTYRDFHTLRSGQGWQPAVIPGERAATIRAAEDAIPLRIQTSGGTFTPGGVWYWNFRHREETARGLDDRSDLYASGVFALRLTGEAPATLTLRACDSTGCDADLPADDSLAAERARQADLLRRAFGDQVPSTHPVLRQLTLAADQFIVARTTPQPFTDNSSASLSPSQRGEGWGEGTHSLSPAHRGEGRGERSVTHTIIAGYHWFNDWGRDTMIALPGLTLATGRPEIAADILRAFARYVSAGLLPNNFPDHAGVIPAHNTADATLWYVIAIQAYAEATGDGTLVDELLPTLREIIARHIAGTRYGIGMDPNDALLRAGEPGVQLTWMDAKVGEWVVTPRVGKPVEINALWYNALRILAGFLTFRGDSAADEYSALAERVRASFHARFAARGRGALADVVDGPDGDDWSLRPNQIFAVSLPYPLVEGDDAAPVVAAVGRALLTSFGLRSLSSNDPHYHGDYGGDQIHRDGAYHQGAVWPWLIGAYVEAHLRIHGDPAASLALLTPFAHHLTDAGLGSISEIFEGDPPLPPRGCVAQAWSVAEVLRVWSRLSDC